MNSTTKYLTLKHLIYVLILLALYVLQAVPGVLAIGGIKPIFVAVFALAIAMYEGEFIGGLYGAAAGLLCDMLGVGLYGFNGFLLCLCCVAAGLLVIYLMRCNLRSCLLFVGVSLLIRGSIEFLFAYGMWGYEGIWRLYVLYTLPTILYSLAVAPLLYWAVGRLHRRFELVLHP